MEKETKKCFDFMTLALSRYSVRDFTDMEIEEEKITRILEAGRIAPTAKNNQCFRVYLLRSQESLKKIRELTRCAFNAPIVLIFTYCINEEYVNTFESDYTSGAQDASIVATHMMLEAKELGIGTCWVNVFPPSEVKEAFSIPENERIVLLMPMGYASKSSSPSERHSAYRPLEELVKIM